MKTDHFYSQILQTEHVHRHTLMHAVKLG